MRRLASSTLVTLICSISPPEAAFALEHVIYLYQPSEIAAQGIVASIQETDSGMLKCKLSFDKERIGVPVASVWFSSQVGDAAVSMQLQLHESKGSDFCYFEVSRSMLMHAHVKIGVVDGIPGGTFYNVSFVDFVDFGTKLPARLKQRESRVRDFILQRRLPRYEDTTPARGNGGDPRVLLEVKTPINPTQRAK